MDREELLNLLHHIITVGSFWHLEYARQHTTKKNYEQIVKDRNTFDKDLLQKGVDIINGLERESDIVKIVIYFEGHKVEFNTKEVSNDQLRHMTEALKNSEDIDLQNSSKKMYIKNDAIVGYEISYKSEYTEIFKKK